MKFILFVLVLTYVNFTFCQNNDNLYHRYINKVYDIFNDNYNSTNKVSVSTSTGTVDYGCLQKNNWVIESHYNSNFKVNTGAKTVSLSSTTSKASIYFTDIPNYYIQFTDDTITELNSRPTASQDFTNGKTSAVSGKYYDFGDNIGYISEMCPMGYWPNGPVCPTSAYYTQTYPLLPYTETSSGGCYSSFTFPSAVLVNGAVLFSWSDATSYKNFNYWHNNALNFEIYDFDVCAGHSAMGIYHHHAFPNCLAEKLNDDGSGHSAIYGFAIDGFPIYGPWQGKGLLAKSCWKARDYSASSSSGCGSEGVRSCLLKNQYDVSQGTTKISSATYYGPKTSETTTTQSGHTISATSGIYYEDYYFDSTCYLGSGTSDDASLNSNNGHDHDGLGFHYHFTVDSDMTPVFPFAVGPKFYGCIANSVAINPMTGSTSTPFCSTSYFSQNGNSKSTCSSTSYGMSPSKSSCV